MTRKRKVMCLLYGPIQEFKKNTQTSITSLKQWKQDIFMQKRFNIRETSFCKYYWSVEKVLRNSKHRNMEQNESSTLNSPTTSVSSSSTAHDGKRFSHHWAWDLYAYTFAILFGIFALSCFAIIVRQCKQSSSSRNVHGRFTTIQLFVAASLKVVALLWSPLLLNEARKKTFTIALIIDCCSMALILSAFSILLLILLETTKTSLAPPRLQNIWVLLAITAVLTLVMLTFNLLVLYADRKLWHFVSYLALSAWGTLICIGYVVAGRRMWSNLQSSRAIGKSSGERRLKNITILVLIAPFITAAMLILTVCLAAAQYGILRRLNMSATTINWKRYVIMFLLKCCELVIVVLIFGVVIRTKSGKGSVEDAPSLQLGTFAEEPPTEENDEDEAPSSATHNAR